ncbi:SLATT domain-containing protein, partial [Saccharibacillus sacchari]
MLHLTLLQQLESLSNKIWITRKSRIRAEDRLRKNDFLTQILVNYYTLIVVGLSIWTLYDNSHAQLISVLLIIASVLLFGLSIFLTSRDFRGRSLAFKDCYIKLDELYNETELLKAISVNLSPQKINELQKKYNDIIYSVENHTSVDYFGVLNDTNKISTTQK